jgi:hypothetical protein
MIMLEQVVPWELLVANAAIVVDRKRDLEKDTPATHTLANLGAGYLFAGGKMLDGTFTQLWLKLHPEWYDKLAATLTMGLGSLGVVCWPSGDWYLVAHSKVHIGNTLVQLLDPPPHQLQRLCRVESKGKEVHGGI